RSANLLTARWDYRADGEPRRRPFGVLNQTLQPARQSAAAAIAGQLQRTGGVRGRAPRHAAGGKLAIEPRGTNTRQQPHDPTRARTGALDDQTDRRMRVAHAPSRLWTIRSISLIPMNGAISPPRPWIQRLRRSRALAPIGR